MSTYKKNRKQPIILLTILLLCPVLIPVFFPSFFRLGNADHFPGDSEMATDGNERGQNNFAIYASMNKSDADQIDRLYDDLIKLEGVERERLWHAAEAFSLWLARLDGSERNSILSLDDPKERLAMVRKLREAQWLAGLPRGDQEKIRAIDKDQDARALLISRISAEEIERKSRNLELARKQILPSITKSGVGSSSLNKNAITTNDRPAKFEELPPDVQLWIGDNLMARLSDYEKKQIRLASGRWPDYPKTIYQLARDHFLLPEPRQPVDSFADIPELIREKYSSTIIEGVMDKKGWTPPRPQNQDYALALAKWAVLEKVPTGFLGPTNAVLLPEPWRELVDKKLMPRLVREERQFLKRAEGKWPDYPRALVDLLVSRRVPLPGKVLPGPPNLWLNALSPQ